MKKFLILAFLASAATVFAAEPSLTERYPGPWKEAVNAPISKVLASKSIRGCGEFKFRESALNRGEFLVYCTRDGTNWSSYIVWIYSGEVTGPHRVSAAIPP